MAELHRLVDWDPEDTTAWRTGNNAVARGNLIWSIATAHIAFSIWYLWSVMVLFMPQAVYGFTATDKLLVGATAALVGAVVRIPYAMANSRFGARNWAVFSSLILLIPTIGAMALLADPGLPLWPYLVCAGLTGLGGGNYAAALTNAEVLYPHRLKGLALGLTGGIVNLGSASTQAVGLVVLATAGHREPYWVCAVYLVLLAVVGAGAALCMNNFSHPIGLADLRHALTVPDTWGVLLLYVAVSGSFLGFAFAFGQVVYVNLLASGQSHALASLHAAEVAFVGPLLGSIARVAGGWSSDRFGGGRITLGALACMIAAGGFLVAVSGHQDVIRGPGDPNKTLMMAGYIVGFIALFIFCGVGKGSVSKLIPTIFAVRCRTLDVSEEQCRRQQHAMSQSVLGLAGALGALGAMVTSLALRQSYLSTHTETPAFVGFLVCYVGAALLTWVRFVRVYGAQEP